jgi:2-phospho-L-lactate guanylyltransferase
LNPSLKEAIAWCVKKQADSVLILPADLPFVSSEDINRLVALGSEKSTVVLSPSLDGGTNALFLNPPNLISVCFGSNSFFKHVKEALGKGVAIKFYSSRGTALDIDSEEDLKRIREIEGDIMSKQVLKNSFPIFHKCSALRKRKLILERQ